MTLKTLFLTAVVTLITITINCEVIFEEDRLLKEPVQSNYAVNVVVNTINKKQVQEVSRGTDKSKTFIATAYCQGNITSTGTTPIEGRTLAVDPKVIPYGTRVHITCDTYPEINGIYIAEDCGGAIKGNRLDIYINNYSRAMDFGVRRVKVSVLN